MPKRYVRIEHDSDDYRLCQEVLRDHHSELIRADCEVVFQFVVCENEAGQMKMPKPNKHGQTVLGKAKCFPAADRAVGAPDFSITLLLNWWELATDEQRRALVDHELCHCGLDDTGEYEKPMSVPHEFEGFHAELARHGPWDHNLQRVDKQLKLWDVQEIERQGERGLELVGKLVDEVKDAGATMTVEFGGKTATIGAAPAPAG